MYLSTVPHCNSSESTFYGLSWIRDRLFQDGDNKCTALKIEKRRYSHCLPCMAFVEHERVSRKGSITASVWSGNKSRLATFRRGAEKKIGSRSVTKSAAQRRQLLCISERGGGERLGDKDGQSAEVADAFKK